jgi:tripartite-type tricarboxylate transporter receptor subunit TctC
MGPGDPRREHQGELTFAAAGEAEWPIYSLNRRRDDRTRQKSREDAVNLIIRGFVAAAVASLALVGPGTAQQYPSKPVKMIVPFPAGGVTDIAARVIAQKLSERLGQQFFVDNIGGAGGNLGMGQVAKAAGDGYTILISSSSVVVNPSLYKNVPFDISKDFIPVTKAGATPNSWVVNASFPVKSMRELIDLIKKEPGKYSVASPGAGTTPSLSIEQLRHALKLDFVVVPFAGGGPMTTSVLGGHTPIVCSALGNYMQLITDGKLRPLSITARKRTSVLPDVPTLEELGIHDQEAETMTGVFVPAGTPPAAVALLQREISAIVNAPDIKARLLELGVEADGGSSADFTAYVRAEVAKWRKVIDEAKVPRI